MRRLYALLILIIAGVVIVASCYPPHVKTPVINPGNPLPGRTVSSLPATRGVGSGSSCAILDGSAGFEPGPWPEHQFPRLLGNDGSYSTGDHSQANIELFANYDVILKANSMPYWTDLGRMGITPDNYTKAIKSYNSDTKILATLHAYGLTCATCFSYSVHPTAREIIDATYDYNYLAKKYNGSILQPGSWFDMNQAVINMSDQQTSDHPTGMYFPEWLADYVISDIMLTYDGGTPYFDGIWVEGMGNVWHKTGGADIDLDENGTADRLEYGKPWINDELTDGWTEFFNLVSGDIDVLAGAAWSPGNDGFDTPSNFIGVNHIASDLFPTDIWYDASGVLCGVDETSSSSCGNWGSSDKDDLWSFHMRQYVN